MSFQFGTNWPGYMNTVGNIAGPLLAYEVLTAFFLEASFLGIMLFGHGRVGERAHVDHGRPKLGELPLGQVRVPGVEGVGDDQTQHRVPEELVSLVVRQPPRLVGVGAMREGAREFPGIHGHPGHLVEVFEEFVDGGRGLERRECGTARHQRGIQPASAIS